jgi:hypothetical protein
MIIGLPDTIRCGTKFCVYACVQPFPLFRPFGDAKLGVAYSTVLYCIVRGIAELSVVTRQKLASCGGWTRQIPEMNEEA